jgi:O-antigen/teichoic acid export membrane protein
MSDNSQILRKLLQSRLAGALSIFAQVRLRPFDTSSEEGRASERKRKLALTVLAAAVAKSIQLTTVLLSVPLTLPYLGSERYGMWMTISSCIVVLNFADLGLGLGLLNAIAAAHGHDDRQAARRAVSSAFFMLLSTCALLAIAFTIVYPSVPWARVFNVHSPLATAEAGPSTAVFVGCFLLNLLVGIVGRIQLGYQEGYRNSLWEACGNLLGLLLLIVAIRSECGLPYLTAAVAGTPVLATVCNGALLIGVNRPWLRPSLSNVSTGCASEILQQGLLFLVLQVAFTLQAASDNILIAHVLGPDAVPEYSVAARLFGVIGAVLAMGLGPLWPAYGEALARNDVTWIRGTFARSVKLTLLMSASTALVLAVCGKGIIRVWAGEAVIPSALLLTSLAVWTVLGGVGNAVGTFLNGVNALRIQVLCACLSVPAAIAAKVVGLLIFGTAGVVLGTIAVYLLVTVIPVIIYLRKLLISMAKSERCAT